MIRKYYDWKDRPTGNWQPPKFNSDTQEKDKPATDKILENLWNSGFNAGLDNAIEVLRFYKGLTTEVDAAIDKMIISLERFKKQTT